MSAAVTREDVERISHEVVDEVIAEAMASLLCGLDAIAAKADSLVDRGGLRVLGFAEGVREARDYVAEVASRAASGTGEDAP